MSLLKVARLSSRVARKHRASLDRAACVRFSSQTDHLSEFFAQPTWSLRTLTDNIEAGKSWITGEELDHLAWLAHIEISEEEQTQAVQDIAKIVGFASTVKQHTSQAKNNSETYLGGMIEEVEESHFRKDIPNMEDLSNVLLANATIRSGNQYVVPNVVGGGHHTSL